MMIERNLAIIAFIISVATLSLLAAGPADSPWPMDGQNAHRTGKSPMLGPTCDPQVLWKLNMGSDVRGRPVLASDGTIHVVTRDRRLLAISPAGNIKWTYSAPVSDDSPSTPAVSNDGTVYFGVEEYLYAVNSDGTEKWRFHVGRDHYGGWVYPPAIGADGAVYVGARGGLYCLNPEGTERWKASYICGGTPAVLSDGSVVAKTSGITIRRFDSDGNLQWSNSMPNSTKSPVIGPQRTIYCGQYDAQLFAINLDTGQTIRTTSLTCTGAMGVSVDKDGSAYITTDDSLEKVASDGTHLWSIRDVACRPGSPLIDASGYIFSSDGQGGNHIRAFSPEGDTIWTFEADEGSGWHFTQPILGNSGVLYAANWSYSHTDGYLYAIIPEPATLSLLAVGAMALIRRRRKKIQLNITCSSPLWERRSRLNLQREARAFSLTRTCLKAATGQVPIVGCPSLAHSIEGLGPDAKGESGISRFAHFAGTQEVRSKKEKKMKRVEMSLLVCLAGSIAVVLCGFCSAVNAAVITFDEIPPANGNFGFLTDEYAHLSILFETTDDGSIFGGISAGDPGNWDLEGTNGPAFLGFNGSSYSLATTFFEQDMNYVSLDVSRSNGSSAGNTFTLEAYDGGTLVDARTVILGPINDWTSVTVSGPGIDRTEWYGEGSGFHPFGVDNLYFIPEPATLSLLTVGAMALIRRRRK